MKIAVLAEQNFNLIDGSTIWLLNVCKLLALQPDFEVTLLLSHRLENRVLADEVPERIRIVDMAGIAAVTGSRATSLSADTVLATLSDWEAAEGAFDRIFVRGTAYLEELLSSRVLAPKVVGYAPSAIPDVAEPEPDWVRQGRAGRMPLVVQSETAKTALESLSDYPAHVVHVVPPIVFHSGEMPTRDPDRAVLCYSGKIDFHYGMDWLLEIARAVGDYDGLGVSLIAGKDTYRPRFRDFFRQMDRFRADLEAGHVGGVDLVANVPHAEAKRRMGQGDFAYCLRHDRYDDVIEISTKIVEFCTLGVAPILNDNALNRALFGDDYPYYVDIAREDVPARVLKIMAGKGSDSYAVAQARIAQVAAGFAAETLSDRLATAIRGAPADLVLSPAPRHVMIATHEPKFLRQFCDYLRGDPQITLGWQYWQSTTKPKSKLGIPDSVDTILCEWCCENAVWHSQNKREGTRLIVRLHRFEAFRDFPERVNWDAVDALIVVSEHFRDLMIDRFGVPAGIIHVMPQYIDWHALDRPKLAQARFTLGLVGINPFDHKRFDRAIDFFATLRAADPRFTLAVRSVMPWEIDWVWNNREEDRARFEAVFERIFSDPDLVGSIRFDLAGSDMEEWYRGVGTILSSSDTEGCHTSVLEGMAAGCYPVVYDWPGARSLFDPYVHADMADAILGLRAFADLGDADLARARAQIAERARPHDVKRFAQDFFRL
ncbi:glycosyltransferase family 4 protein [Sulfitobacter sp. HNIBRBA3233]|uniref:glycosyltransferase family 4 protein n=1 Tax=Sulfitobacter marinivivus TaxID=3158558 RepID=UPI0032DEF6A0